MADYTLSGPKVEPQGKAKQRPGLESQQKSTKTSSHKIPNAKLHSNSGRHIEREISLAPNHFALLKPPTIPTLATQILFFLSPGVGGGRSKRKKKSTTGVIAFYTSDF